MSRDNRKFAAANDYEVGSPPPSGYVQWHEWAAAQHAHGLRQAQCKSCRLWRFPQELNEQGECWIHRRADKATQASGGGEL